MCLDLKFRITFPRIALKPKVVYKALKFRVDCKTQTEVLKHGDYLQAIINGQTYEGRISVDLDNGIKFFCTNDENLDGMKTIDKLGFQYSWLLGYNIEALRINDVDVSYPPMSKYFTPYRDMLVKMGNTYKSKLSKEGASIEKGIHSFASQKDAKNLGYDCVAKCIIPKWSIYYKGLYERDPAYASNVLTYIEIVE